MINNEKFLARFRSYGIESLKLFGYHTSRSREYDFIMNNVSQNKSVILDMGSVGSLLPLKLAKKGHKVYTVDTREYHEKHPLITSINNDINGIDSPEIHADEITCVSKLEHIGVLAYGACIVSQPYKWIKEWFEVVKELIVVNSEDEAVETYEWLLSSDEERLKIGERDRQRILKQHTFRHSAETIVSMAGRFN
ncbi:MAG: glycosyltransferase [Euryarchaeota archaeon]|nr:glycosyltransferase [Euryarchaeota archaeon]